MVIKLNNKDIHLALRAFLQQHNIVDSYTEIDIALTVGRGVNAGVTAEITILDSSNDDSQVEDTLEEPASKSSLFADNEETPTDQES